MMKILVISVAIAITVGIIVDLAKRIPVCDALVDTSNARRRRKGLLFDVRILSHAAPNLWWLLTLYCNYWGLEIYYYPEPYWGCIKGYTRKIGIWLWGVGFIIDLGRTGKGADDCIVRQFPSRKWYEFQM